MHYADQMAELHTWVQRRLKRLRHNPRFELRAHYDGYDYLRIDLFEPFQGEMHRTNHCVSVSSRVSGGKASIVVLVSVTIAGHFNEMQPRLLATRQLHDIAAGIWEQVADKTFEIQGGSTQSSEVT